jgi:hypothetical protein
MEAVTQNWWKLRSKEPSRCVVIIKRYLLQSKNATRNNQQFDNTLPLTSRQHVSAVKQSSSGQSRTQSRNMESVHCMGSHIIYNGTLK